MNNSHFTAQNASRRGTFGVRKSLFFSTFLLSLLLCLFAVDLCSAQLTFRLPNKPSDTSPYGTQCIYVDSLTGPSVGVECLTINELITYLAGNGLEPALGFAPENTANKGADNGYAGLDSTGRVPAAQLQTYVPLGIPGTEADGKIYFDGAMAGSSSTLASSTATFTTADVGKLICVDCAGTGNTEGCGTISTFVSSGSVTLSFSNPNSSISSKEFRYATNDSAAIQSYISGLSAGANISLPCVNYGLNATITLPANVAFRISGCAAGVPNTQNNLQNTGAKQALTSGTGLWFLTKSMSGPALLVSGNTSYSSSNATSIVEHLSLYGGAAQNWDGGGNNGINVINWQGLILNDLYVMNFAGDGVYIDGSGTNGQQYIEHVTLKNVFSSWNGAHGIHVGSGTAVPDISTVSIDTCTIETNGKSAIYLNGYNSNIQAPSIINSVLAWNNVLGVSNPEGNVTEIWISGAPTAGVIRGNYFEVNTSNGLGHSTAIFDNSMLWLGTDISGNYYFPASAYPHFIFQTGGGNYYTNISNFSCNAGTGANNFSQIIHRGACVSDSTACTAGTTYASGGSTLCRVECNGTNWVETGTTAGCN